MKCGILFAALFALIGSSLASCRRAADPREIATVDSLITTLHAARLTLNELDTHRYTTADSILGAARAGFLDRFSDTLDKATAATLGDQFVQLREAHRRALEHRRVSQVVAHGSERLTRLRNDLINGALKEDAVRQAIAKESTAAKALERSVLQVIEDHRANQRALERQVGIDSLLATPPVGIEER